MDTKSNYELVLKKTEWGLYYKFIIALCYFCYLALAFAYMALFVIIPFSLCNIKMSEDRLSLALGLFFVGSAIGTYISGCTLDWFGRKSTITLYLVFVFCGCFIGGFATGSIMLMFAIIITGFSLSSTKLALKIYLMEHILASSRGEKTLLLDAFFTIGCLISLGLTLVFSPYLSVYIEDLRVISWRMLFAASGALCIKCSCVTALIYESPRFLLMKGHFSHAKEILKHIYAINCSEHSDNWPINPELEITHLIQPQIFQNERISSKFWDNVGKFFCRTKILMKNAFKKPYLKYTCLFFWLKIITHQSTISMILWMSTMAFTLENNRSGLPEGPKQFTFTLIPKNYRLNVTNIIFIHSNVTTTCSFKTDVKYVYLLLIYLGFLLIGQIILAFMIDKIGRKLPLVFGFLCCSLGCATFVIAMPSIYRYMLLTTVILFYGLIRNILDMAIIEVFPTRLRGTASGLTNFIPEILSALNFILMNVPYYVWCSTYTGLLFVGIILSLFVPHIRKQPMVELIN